MRQIRRSQTWLNQTNHEMLDCSVLPFWAPGNSVPVSVKSDTKQNPTFQPENGQGSYVMLEGGKLTHMVNEHIVTGIKFKKIHILHFVPKYKTTRKAGKYKLFWKLNIINPYFMFWGIKTQGLLVLSMFHCSLFEPVSLPARLDLILIFCYKARNWKSLGPNIWSRIADFPPCISNSTEFQGDIFTLLYTGQWGKVMGDVSCIISVKRLSISLLFVHIHTCSHIPPLHASYNRQKKLGQVLYEFISKKHWKWNDQRTESSLTSLLLLRLELSKLLNLVGESKQYHIFVFGELRLNHVRLCLKCLPMISFVQESRHSIP